MKSSKKIRKASPKQLAQQQLFGAAVLLLRPFSTVIQMGFRQKARRAKKPPFSMAMKVALGDAVIHEDGVRRIDPAKLILSNGVLEGVAIHEVIRDQETITVHYTDNAICRKLNSSEDHVLLCAYHEKEERVMTNTRVAMRQDSKVIVDVPADLVNEDLHLYLLVHSPDKRNWSRSVYVKLAVGGTNSR